MRQHIKIGIVDDHAVARAGLRAYVSQMDDLEVVGEAADGHAAIDLVQNFAIDVLVMDLSMPGQSGIEAISKLRILSPSTGILILTGYAEAKYATNLIRLGAHGYLTKDGSLSEVVEAIHVIASGSRYLTPCVASLLADPLNAAVGGPVPHEALTGREMQVFLRLAIGEPSCVVAKALSLNVKTVSAHRSRVMKKLGLRSNADLAYYAIKNGLIV